jgi:hypothetical protein
MWGILIFGVENFEKPGFGRKNQLKTWMSSHLGQLHMPH